MFSFKTVNLSWIVEHARTSEISAQMYAGAERHKDDLSICQYVGCLLTVKPGTFFEKKFSLIRISTMLQTRRLKKLIR